MTDCVCLQAPLKFWFLSNFASPQFKQFMPKMAEELGFEFEFVTYAWPHWLHRQTEKQRVMSVISPRFSLCSADFRVVSPLLSLTSADSRSSLSSSLLIHALILADFRSRLWLPGGLTRSCS